VRTGNHGLEWSGLELALLVKLSDAEVARRTGRTRVAVTVKRNRLGIPNRFDGL
jgi:hypothetical protein